MSLLLPLSEALGLSVTDLLRGGPEEPERPAEAPPPDPAGDLLAYTRRTAPQRRERIRPPVNLPRKSLAPQFYRRSVDSFRRFPYDIPIPTKDVIHMDPKPVGPLIRQRRKERGLTQRDLAALLNVTDKAVSKWERDLSLPDVSLLLPLSEALGLSVTDLLRGGPEEPERPAESPPPDPAGDLLAYTRRTAPQRRERIRLWLFAGLSGSFLLSAAVCWICDMALNRTLGWSLVVCCSLTLAWAVLLPLLTLRRNPVPWALAALSAAILPYLYILGDLLKEPRVFRFGLPIAPAAALYLWGVWGVFRRHRLRRWYAAGEILLLTAVLNFAVNIMVSLLLPGEVLWGGILITLALSAGCHLADYVLGRRGELP